jgi:hypothetical protein
MEAELDGLICSGRFNGNKITYELIEDRIHKSKKINKENSVAELARIYFSSRRPATLEDFAWWSGLTLTKIKNSLLINDEDVYLSGSEKSGGNRPSLTIKKTKSSVYLLPAFDEYLLSYKDRSAIISSGDHRKAVSNNGIFWPLIIENGKAAGTWKRTLKNDKVLIEVDCFAPVKGNTCDHIEKEALKYGKFLERDIILKFVNN